MYAGNATRKAKGGLSIGVPGQLAGLHLAWNQHGRLPWKRLVKPAENLARKGEVFTSNGDLLKVGDICYNKKLAKTLRKISVYGVETFYNGSIGFNLVNRIQEAGGILTITDLKKYKVKVREPITANILGLKIITMPLPSSGGVSMMLVLNILAQYAIPSGLSGSLGTHRLIEALKHAFAVRMNLGDPDFVKVSKVVADMLSPKTFGPNYYGGRWNQIHDHGTSHLSIVDTKRNAVSITNTVNGYFGSKILSPSTGIVLNNEMDDFSMPSNNSSGDTPPPAPPNFVHPGKRPLSSMTPHNRFEAVVGASGGANIIAATTQVLLNHFALGMDPLLSVMAPRVYHQLIPNVVRYENWTSVIGDHFEVPETIRTDLRKKGHVLERATSATESQFIVHDLDGKGHGELVVVSDPRKGGFPAGF
ncbi:hypothetical protein ES288_1Z013100v1 [Gossypium darwinii]|uniref:Gamma-glutamyltransferase n=1 Tax=Gossypium darwinii TaxID=34276 RepID=A0A5C7J082_GOSDA|nr:hypothetical protein ES288_1Z013100v1 [Gossypium darwinii]